VRRPSFDNLLRVLNRQVPERPTLFEYFLNDRLYLKLSGYASVPEWGTLDYYRMLIAASAAAGYDYITVQVPDFWFPVKHVRQAASYSLNDTAVICDRASFEEYLWPDPARARYSLLSEIVALLPDGMKVVVHDPSGVLESVVALLGFAPLCYLLADDPKLLGDVFEAVGSRLVQYFSTAARYKAVGALISSDDWGFATQTMLPPEVLRSYLFPWHKQIVQAIHEAGKPAILHSCGNLEAVMDDIIDDMGFDAKHSFEDKICPVEEAYERWGDRISILGGIDVDYVCRSTPGEIRQRSRAMLQRSAARGGYALGTGNSVPEYVPDENYFAMISVVAEEE